MGERLLCKQEARGSIPLTSILVCGPMGVSFEGVRLGSLGTTEAMVYAIAPGSAGGIGGSQKRSLTCE